MHSIGVFLIAKYIIVFITYVYCLSINCINLHSVVKNYFRDTYF